MGAGDNPAPALMQKFAGVFGFQVFLEIDLPNAGFLKDLDLGPN